MLYPLLPLSALPFIRLLSLFLVHSALVLLTSLFLRISSLHTQPPQPGLAVLRGFHCFPVRRVTSSLLSKYAVSMWNASAFSCQSKLQASTHHGVIGADEKKTVTSIIIQAFGGTAQQPHQSRLHQPDRVVITQIAVTFKCKMKVNQ